MATANLTRTVADSPTRNCTKDGCGRPLRAKGLCGTHYNQQMPNRYKMHEIACAWCGVKAMKYTANSRYAKTYCSSTCRDRGLSGKGDACEIPAEHWSRWYGATSTWVQPKAKRPTFQVGACAECAALIVEPTGQTASTYCSDRCITRTHKRRRRARESQAPGAFTFVQVMRQYAKQGNTCSYCEQPANGLPDPEHVLPLSRGGRNDMSNIVAACRACNTDKGDLTLTEWAADRARRDLPALHTALDSAAYMHLYHAQPTAPAWRDRVAA